MPKQVWKIERFDGGLNTNSDPRDIADNELAAATDIIVDNVGKIRTMGGTTAHDAAASASGTISAGYGLFQFSHDRLGGHLATEHLDETDFATHANWDVTGECVDSGGNLTWTFGSGALDGTAQQVYGDRAQVGIPGIEYGFRYTVAVTTAPDYFTLTLDNFPASSTTLPFTAGTHTVSFTSHANAATSAFTITGTDDVGGTTTEGVFSIDNVSLYIDDETGDDYLAFGDTDTSANLDIYSRVADEAGGSGWGGSVVDLGSITGMKPCFYQADGALRVSDGSFVGNQNKWYGYIDQTHFAVDADGDAIAPGGSPDAYDGWYVKSLDLAKPTGGVYGPAVAFTDTTSAVVATIIEYGSGGTDIFRYWANFDGKEYIAISTDGSAQARVITQASSDHDDLVTVANAVAGGWGTEAIEIYPPIGKGFNVYFDNSSDDGSWDRPTYYIGTTFIYQGGQESNVFDIYAGGNRSIGSDNILSVGGSALDVKIFATSPYDPFIIGGRIYIKTAVKGAPWVLLVDISLKDGARTDLTSDYIAWTLRTATGSGDAPSNIYLTVDLGAIVDPSPWTYETINGYQADESIDIGALGEGFTTAVVANRQTYIGNVRREGKDGVTRTEGDAMYKSMPGKFDTFPIARKIEASIQDGDQIVKLEEYADRILQFKKTKMHLINISQDVEFLEDTFKHKGVSHPASVCKTDFGIAWANREGCYLYDGKNVINLLEKKGRQIVKESEWNNFLTADKDGTGALCTPMVGYLPKKRQIIVFDDITNTSTTDPRMYLYDMVTQSWVQGANDSSTRIIDILKTNFVTDWNGDLIYAHTSGTMVKWDDTSDITDTISFKTKDIDFGNPAVRKKVYKVYVSYKGDGGEITVNYGTNGNSTMTGQFYITGSSGASTKANAADLCIYNGDVGTNDWVLAELRPSSSINNIYSFQLKFDGGSTDANFEINDISIVYRMKNIK